MKVLNEKQVRQFFTSTDIYVKRIDKDFYEINLKGYRKLILRPTKEQCQHALESCREATKIITDINAELTYTQIYYFFSQNPEFTVMQVYEKEEKVIRIKLSNFDENLNWYNSNSMILYDKSIKGIIECISELQKQKTEHWLKIKYRIPNN